LTSPNAPGRPRLSLVVIARNEETRLRRCLTSVAADEIIVVDGQSTDGTRETARACGAVVIETSDWPGFGPQKNRGLDAATGEWVLSLDADEWIEPPLMAEIEKVIADPDALDLYVLPRRSRFCGRVVRHCGWSPDEVLRLFRRDKARFSDDIVHERVVQKGQPGHLGQPIEHEAIVSAEDARQKALRYGTAGAEQLAARGKRGGRFKAVLHAGWTYIRVLLMMRGFLDGLTGLRVATYQAAQTYRKWAHLAELNRSARGRFPPAQPRR
jgi:glycosyltransferase involved in cell wall biosynthesis